MRRIYESDALYRDDDEAHAPKERKRQTTLQSFRHVPSAALSDAFLPQRLRRRCISVDVRSPNSTYRVGEPIPFRVTLRNRAPIAVTIPTASPVLWEWSVDGNVEASAVPLRDPPDEPGRFHFGRGERKEFQKRWDQRFRVERHEWEPAEPGTYTIAAGINVAGGAQTRLRAETTVEIVR